MGFQWPNLLHCPKFLMFLTSLFGLMKTCIWWTRLQGESWHKHLKDWKFCQKLDQKMPHNSGHWISMVWFFLNIERIYIYKSLFIIDFFLVYDQLAFNDNCFEFVQESENDVTYNEAQDHCENLNGTLLNENRLEDVQNVCKYFYFYLWIYNFSFH